MFVWYFRRTSERANEQTDKQETETMTLTIRMRYGYTVTITGDDSSATWTSDPAAAGSYSKQGQCGIELAGGTSGTVTGGYFATSHVTLCGNQNDVPEFGTLGALAVLSATGLFIFWKRR